MLSRLDRNKFRPVLVFGDKGNEALWAGEEVYEYNGSNISNCEHCPTWRSLPGLYQFVRSILVSPFEIVSLIRLFRMLQPDLLHINCGQSIVAGMLAKRLGIPVIWHVRELVLPNWIGKFQDHVYASCATKVIAVSQAALERLPKCKASGKSSIVFNAVKLKKPCLLDRNATRSQLGLAESDFIVLALGQVNLAKGYAFLAEVADKFGSNMPVFVLAGSFEDKKCSSFHRVLRVVYRYLKGGDPRYRLEVSHILNKWQEYRAAGKAIFPGYLASDSLLSIADLIVCPNTLPESFGRTIIEAYNYGLPVCATNIGGFREIVDDGETGFLISLDPMEWATKISYFMTKKDEIFVMQEMARVKARTFDVAQHVKILESLYEEILDGVNE